MSYFAQLGKKLLSWTTSKFGKNAVFAVALCCAFFAGTILMYINGKWNERSERIHSVTETSRIPSTMPKLGVSVQRLPHALVSSSAVELINATARTRAVCLTGHRGQFLLKSTMANSLINNILKPNDADLFVFITVDDISTFPIEEFQRLYEPWLKRFVIIEDSALESEIASYNFAKLRNVDMNQLRFKTLKLFLKLHKCYNTLIAPYELDRGMVEYQQVFYTRPDLQFFRPLKMAKYVNDAVLYSPRPNGWEQIRSSPPDSENNGVFFFPWENDAPGVNDQSFLASARIFRLLSNAMWLLLPEVPETNHIRNKFQEHVVWWILRDRFKITVKWILDSPNEICRDSMPCYK